jgi:hypothetical protein
MAVYEITPEEQSPGGMIIAEYRVSAPRAGLGHSGLKCASPPGKFDVEGPEQRAVGGHASVTSRLGDEAFLAQTQGGSIAWVALAGSLKATRACAENWPMSLAC